MSVKFKDYYEVLGVKRSASSEEIQMSYRKLARKYHPDINKSKGAEKRIREINEAYEALHDPEKRERYDTLGANWKTGQDFTPPPGWENVRFQTGFGDRAATGGASDFFRSLFGNLGGTGGFGGFDGFEGFTDPRGGGRAQFRSRGENLHGQIEITLNEAYHGAKKKIHLQSPTRRPDGAVVMESHTYDVTAPRGVTNGSKIRLAGRGAPGVGGGPPGDLLLSVSLRPDPRFKVHNHDLKTTIQVTPWEAALGADLQVETLDGKVKMKLPAGTQGGQTLRLRERGLPRIRGKQGDLLATVKIAIPKELTTEERELFEQLAEKSKFSPRDER